MANLSQLTDMGYLQITVLTNSTLFVCIIDTDCLSLYLAISSEITDQIFVTYFLVPLVHEIPADFRLRSAAGKLESHHGNLLSRS